jgi:hypothetical protein
LRNTSFEDCGREHALVQSALPLHRREVRTTGIGERTQDEPAFRSNSPGYAVLYDFGRLLLPLESLQAFRSRSISSFRYRF